MLAGKGPGMCLRRHHVRHSWKTPSDRATKTKIGTKGTLFPTVLDVACVGLIVRKIEEVSLNQKCSTLKSSWLRRQRSTLQYYWLYFPKKNPSQYVQQLRDYGDVGGLYRSLGAHMKSSLCLWASQRDRVFEAYQCFPWIYRFMQGLH